MLLTFVTALSFAYPAKAQEINGTPGSPSATIAIPGNQLPPPPVPFGGVIKENATDSTPYWPPRVVPPKGAPNILLIMTDDQGLRHFEHVWRGHPDARDGSDRGGGIALHAVPFHRALLANTGGADHRAQPSFSWLRRGWGIVNRLSGL